MAGASKSTASQTFDLELFPESSATLSLFQDVTNINELKQRLIAKEIDAVMLTPTMVVSPFQILVAVNKGLHVHATGQAKTKTVNSEVIFNMSPSSNISDSFKTFAMRAEDKAIIVIVLNDPDLSKLETVSAAIQGVEVPLDQISRYTDELAIKKKYCVTDAELSIGSLEDAVVCKMATVDVS